MLDWLFTHVGFLQGVFSLLASVWAVAKLLNRAILKHLSEHLVTREDFGRLESKVDELLTGKRVDRKRASAKDTKHSRWF